ncbi:hypothetical protein [Streptomyces malaysiensis]
MTKIEITAEQLEATIREVAAERPDYIYKTPEGSDICRYVHTDNDSGVQIPGCLIGHALNRLGVPLADLCRNEGTDAASVIHTYTTLGTWDPAVMAAENAQFEQDQGSTWSEAVRIAFPKHSN